MALGLGNIWSISLTGKALWTWVIRQFHKLCDAADLPETDASNEKFVFYSLRHTWATWFSAQVGDQDRLIDRGGWSDAEMARRYRKYPTADLAVRLRAHGWEFKP
ncbi:phage integrase family protein [Yoonia maritima]|uniref:Phage integrase family protein n=1 Tax=Yoonia maritima TaxID=1435347 RepID=A0A2T0W2R4_9RHOB|nr:tyrosine-type recombinase/integrase [Yoonia maritima]PRY79511.1 phage integrase family protein [Yoonia maritima]